MDTAHRRKRLNELLAAKFHDDRGAFQTQTRYTRGRIFQLLHPAFEFGDLAARNVEKRLGIGKGWLDANFGIDSIDAYTESLHAAEEYAMELEDWQIEVLMNTLKRISALEPADGRAKLSGVFERLRTFGRKSPRSRPFRKVEK